MLYCKTPKLSPYPYISLMPFLVGLYSLFVGPTFDIFVVVLYSERSFLAGLQYVNHKVPRLKKNLFSFQDQHCGTKVYSKSYSMVQNSKKLGSQAKITIQDVVLLPVFKVIIIDVTLLKCTVWRHITLKRIKLFIQNIAMYLISQHSFL